MVAYVWGRAFARVQLRFFTLRRSFFCPVFPRPTRGILAVGSCVGQEGLGCRFFRDLSPRPYPDTLSPSPGP